jgi:hypothetical protein
MSKVEVADRLRKIAEHNLTATEIGKGLLAVSLIPIGIALHEHGILVGSREARGVLFKNVDQLRENGVPFYKMYGIWNEIAQFGQSALNKTGISELGAEISATSGAMLWILGKFTEVKTWKSKIKVSDSVLPWIANRLDAREKMAPQPVS